MKLPRAILFDLDDTILVAFGPAQSQWRRTIAAFADQLGPIEATVIAAAIEAASTGLWADPARHKYWRHRVGDARRRIVATAFAALAAAGHAVPSERSSQRNASPLSASQASPRFRRVLRFPVTAATARLISSDPGGRDGPPSQAALMMPLSIRLAKPGSAVPNADMSGANCIGSIFILSGLPRADFTVTVGAFRTRWSSSWDSPCRVVPPSVVASPTTALLGTFARSTGRLSSF
jgi:hypothetical protein